MIEAIVTEARAAVTELLTTANLSCGDLFVVGCSSSEIAGGVIGHASSLDCAEAAYEGIAPALQERGIYLCAQCCEHLNRCIIMERAAAEEYGYEIVCVVPQPKAGGSFAATAWKQMRDPVAVERIAAHAGMDIGDTLIGMHLRAVAVPVRIAQNTIGQARVVCARTRPKFIGGIRARYENEEER